MKVIRPWKYHLMTPCGGDILDEPAPGSRLGVKSALFSPY